MGKFGGGLQGKLRIIRLHQQFIEAFFNIITDRAQLVTGEFQVEMTECFLTVGQTMGIFRTDKNQRIRLQPDSFSVDIMLGSGKKEGKFKECVIVKNRVNAVGIEITPGIVLNILFLTCG